MSEEDYSDDGLEDLGPLELTNPLAIVKTDINFLVINTKRLIRIGDLQPLIRSIRRRGFLKEFHVTLFPDSFNIFEGNLRVLAAAIVNLQTVPCRRVSWDEYHRT